MKYNKHKKYFLYHKLRLHFRKKSEIIWLCLNIKNPSKLIIFLILDTKVSEYNLFIT